ncbi:hypothetical protein BJ912DRAFT_1008887, partial [Pholiota molesta]
LDRLNERQLEEKTKHSKKGVERAATHLGFFGISGPLILVVHDCSRRPKWVPEEVTDLHVNPGFDLDAAPSSRRLQLYNLEASRWISCAPGFPLSVTKNGYLLLHARDPIIGFCKDLFAVQSHYPSMPSDIVISNTLSPSAGTPSLESSQGFASASTVVNTLKVDDMDTGSELAFPTNTVSSESALHRIVADKLDHFAARFRQQGSVEQALRINSWLDDELSREDTSEVYFSFTRSSHHV